MTLDVPRLQTTMRILRERADLSQEELAGILGRAQPEVSMWERGQEKMSDAIRNQVAGVLRSRLHSIRPVLQADDLDRPWDEVLVEWKAREAAASASSAASDDKEPPVQVS